NGTQAIELPFYIAAGSPGGTIDVKLTDLGWPATMSSLSFSLTNSSTLLGVLAQPGSMSFAIAGGGLYSATVYGIADASYGSGIYSLNLSYSPVPLPAAAWLFASCFAVVGLRRRAGKQTVINAG